jgi:hypothetical protein
MFMSTFYEGGSIMYTRLIYLISFVLVLSLVGQVQAQSSGDDVITWTGAVDDDWFNPENWSLDIIPVERGEGSWVRCRNGEPGPTIASPGAVAGRVFLGYDQAGGFLTIVDGGTLDIAWTDGDVRIGQNGFPGTLNMFGGILTIGRDLDISDDAGSLGVVNMSGGTINIGDDLELPNTAGNTGTLNMTGGTINITDNFDMLEVGTVEVHLNGGTINIGDDLQLDDPGEFSIGGGTLIIDGNADATVQGFIDNGWITAYDANGTVYVDYDATEDKTTVYAIHDLNPNPPDGGNAAPGTITLEWTVDAGTLVDVVFGTSPDWTTWEKLVDKQAVTSVSVTVVAKQRYYWAVDTYAPGAEDPNYGPVFSFLADNAPPIVYAGDDVTTWLDNGSVDVALAGTVTDTDPTTTIWTVVSEPDDPNSPDAVIADAAALNTSITLSAPGEYVLQLEADDGEYTGSDTMTIIVHSDSCEAAKSLPDYVPLVGDVNEDCMVDFRDFALIAVNWLEDNAL